MQHAQFPSIQDIWEDYELLCQALRRHAKILLQESAEFAQHASERKLALRLQRARSELD